MAPHGRRNFLDRPILRKIQPKGKRSRRIHIIHLGDRNLRRRRIPGARVGDREAGDDTIAHFGIHHGGGVAPHLAFAAVVAVVVGNGVESIVVDAVRAEILQERLLVQPDLRLCWFAPAGGGVTWLKASRKMSEETFNAAAMRTTGRP